MLVALIVAGLIAWQIEPYLYGAMEGRINTAVKHILDPKGIGYTTAFHTATEPFMLKLKLSFYIALVMTFPYIIVQIWGFVAPALKPSEQRPFKKLAPASATLFLMGAGFAYAAVPSMFAWFATFSEEFPGTSIIQEAGSQLFLVVKMMLAFGVAFQLPLIVYGLGLAGILTAETLVKYWRHGATAIFVIAAVVTPSNDPFSMLMMALPLTALFIGSVYAVKFMERRRAKENPPEIQGTPVALDPTDPLDTFPLEPRSETEEVNQTST